MNTTVLTRILSVLFGLFIVCCCVQSEVSIQKLKEQIKVLQNEQLKLMEMIDNLEDHCSVTTSGCNCSSGADVKLDHENEFLILPVTFSFANMGDRVRLTASYENNEDLTSYWSIESYNWLTKPPVNPPYATFLSNGNQAIREGNFTTSIDLTFNEAVPLISFILFNRSTPNIQTTYNGAYGIPSKNWIVQAVHTSRPQLIVDDILSAPATGNLTFNITVKDSGSDNFGLFPEFCYLNGSTEDEEILCATSFLEHNLHSEEVDVDKENVRTTTFIAPESVYRQGGEIIVWVSTSAEENTDGNSSPRLVDEVWYSRAIQLVPHGRSSPFPEGFVLFVDWFGGDQYFSSFPKFGSFSCMAFGNPRPVIEIFKDSQKLPTNNVAWSRFSTKAFTAFSDIIGDINGTYVCKARAGSNVIEKETNVKVGTKAVTTMAILMTNNSNEVSVLCSGSGVPAPDITFYANIRYGSLLKDKGWASESTTDYNVTFSTQRSKEWTATVASVIPRPDKTDLHSIYCEAGYLNEDDNIRGVEIYP